jgi:hypothetical protein
VFVCLHLGHKNAFPLFKMTKNAILLNVVKDVKLSNTKKLLFALKVCKLNEIF